ncbi:MAG: exodeoxyribonuclease VII large subunit [Lachnospiraceae bacterium]|nr:exodeoxyribonuclease VII large subunit [Lachnospiraceae bacterium]
MIKEFSVTQITEYIASIIKRDYVLGSVCIKGEISNCRESSGHIFFTLKDGNAQLPAVIFNYAKALGIKCRPRDGIMVKAGGYIGVYPQAGRYQLYCSVLEEDGVGSVYEQFEALKAKLNAEGLFLEEHKKQLPKYVRTLGVITAENGAALQDIINVSRRRNPHLKIIVYPATVQGNGAAQTLIAGLKRMEKIRPDCVIIGRGGGSIEDLWCFNDEELARTVYNCTVPIISAVGHEIDFTIIDFVADRRAATPSQAAELAVYEYSAFKSELVEYHSRLLTDMLDCIRSTRDMNSRYILALKNFSPQNRLDNYKMRSAQYSEKLEHELKKKLQNYRYNLEKYDSQTENAFHNKLTGKKHLLELMKAKLDGLAPTNKLEQGYAYVTDSEGRNIDSIDKVNNGDTINILVKDGTINASVIK